MTTGRIVRRRLALALPLLLILFLCSCVAPVAADVAAERDRWTAVRDVTADGQVDATERPLVLQLLEEWDRKIAVDERLVASGDTTAQDLVRAYGIAAVQVFLVPELRKRAPEMFRLVDRNADGMLDEAELAAVDPRSPVFAAVVISTAAHLLSKHHGQ